MANTTVKTSSTQPINTAAGGQLDASDTEIKIIQTMYDRIFDILTYSPGGSQTPAFSAQTTFFQMVPNGLPINPKDFANALSPINPNGSLLSAEMFARLVDPVPAVQADYASTTVSIDQMYGEIVNGANALEQPSAAAVQQYNAAYNYLNVTTTIKDYMGNSQQQVQPSPIYQNYLNNRDAYVAALAAYRTAYLGYDLTDPAQQKQWQANSPLLQNAINRTWNTWRSGGASQVEEALAAVDHSINSAVKTILEQDQQMYAQQALTSNTPGLPSWHLSYGTPTNWMDPAATGFTQFKLDTSNLNQTASSRFTSFGGGASFNYGLWSASASAEHSSTDQQSHMDATNISLSFELGVIQVYRSWLDGTLFSMGGWTMGAAFPKGKISTGDLTTAKTGGTQVPLPLIPTAVIVARNIQITGNWSTQDQSHIAEATSGSASVGWGPFAISGHYQNSSSQDAFSSTVQNGSIKVPGLQVIGWLSQIIPLSPPA